jgi:hypothetical protein
MYLLDTCYRPEKWKVHKGTYLYIRAYVCRTRALYYHVLHCVYTFSVKCCTCIILIFGSHFQLI